MAIHTLKVLDKTVWSDNLFSFRTTRPDGFRFEAGQFVRLGIKPALLSAHLAKNQNAIGQDNIIQGNTNQNDASQPNPSDELIFRAYSIVSSPYEDFLEFFSVVVLNGAFTSRLQYLQSDDCLFLDSTPYGFLTLSRYQSPTPKDLWLLATGTGVAPFLSMLQSLEVWQNYQHIVLAYSVRTQNELAYLQTINDLGQFANLVDKPAKFTFVPIITREQVADCLHERLPILLQNGKLAKSAGIALNADTSHIMLCGNPDMVDDTKETLKAMGFSMNRRGVGNIAVENYW